MINNYLEINDYIFKIMHPLLETGIRLFDIVLFDNKQRVFMT